VGRAVNEIAHGNKGGGKADGRAVERRDEDFGVCIECMCDLKRQFYSLAKKKLR